MEENPSSPPPLTACPACGCRDLFIRKNFPQKLGLVIVCAAAGAFFVLAASRTNFYLGALVLLGAVAVDLVLFIFVPKITVCYRCRKEFKDHPINPAHGGYDLAMGEKYRKA